MKAPGEAQKTFPLSIDAARRARRWLHATGVVPPELADEVDLVVSELVSNSVVHSGLAEPDVVLVRVASVGAGVAGEVVDGGRGMGRDPGHDEGSRGLRIVDGTVSRWGHTDHPTRVWFELRPRRGRRTSHRPAA
jgi:anti-sigma regulatory factor (Ser/Thr protein kinase)